MWSLGTSALVHPPTHPHPNAKPYPHFTLRSRNEPDSHLNCSFGLYVKVLSYGVSTDSSLCRMWDTHPPTLTLTLPRSWHFLRWNRATRHSSSIQRIDTLHVTYDLALSRLVEPGGSTVRKRSSGGFARPTCLAVQPPSSPSTSRVFLDLTVAHAWLLLVDSLQGEAAGTEADPSTLVSFMMKGALVWYSS